MAGYPWYYAFGSADWCWVGDNYSDEHLCCDFGSGN